MSARLGKRRRVTSRVACTAASRPLASTANQADRPSSTYFSIASARSRMAAGVRKYAIESFMAGAARLRSRVFAGPKDDRAAGVAHPQRCSLVEASPLGLAQLVRRGLLDGEVARRLL